VRTRVVAAALFAALLAVPLAMGTRYDSLPLSTYPMFAGDRGRVVAVPTIVAVGRDGAIERLSSQLIGGTDEPMLAFETVAAALRAGDAPALCREVAARLGTTKAASRIAVVTERYDTLAWFDGAREPRARVVHASCAIAP
jgi:hypothetical protein